MTLLNENNAQYPDKINYNNPQHLSVEALELHYRVNASILKYLELHEGKEISNTMGDFFKKCLDSSTFLKKSLSKVTSEPAVKEVVAEAPAKPVESTASSGFQEQFLNSLNKLGSEVEEIPMEVENVNDKKVENIEKEEKEIPNVEEKESDETDKIDKKEVDNDDVKIIEPVTASVICISDSEEEKDLKLKGSK